MKQLITIGNLAKATGVSKGTLRYYEAIGLIPKPQRSESGYRLYSETDVRRVQLIAQAGQLGMNLREIADLLNWASQETCQPFQQHFAELVARKIDELDNKITELTELRKSLNSLHTQLSRFADNETKEKQTVLECSSCYCLETLEGKEVDRDVRLLSGKR